MPIITPTFATSTDLAPLGQEALNFLKFLTSPELQYELWPLKLIFVFCGLGFIFFFFYFALHSEWIHWTSASDAYDFFVAKKKLQGITNTKNQQAWKKIKKDLEKNYEAQWKVSVIEAVSFLDQILTKAGYTGDNLKERLEKIPAEDMSNLSALFQAEGIYHDIILDPNYRLTRDKAQDIISNIEQALIQLEFI